MDTTGHHTGGIQSVERAVAVLKAFGDAEPDLGVTELARRLKLHKSTVSRLLSTLEAGGFVQQDPHSGRYRLGLQLAALAGLALTQYDLRDIARPLLVDLATRVGETVTLSVLDDDMAVNIDQVLAPQPVKHLGWIGRRLPLHCTAAGKPLLAFLPQAQVDRLLSRPLDRYTSRTVTNPALIRREIEQIRAQGYAVGLEQYEVELNAVGSAVRDHRGDVSASITISGPSFRVTPARSQELGALVRQTAERVSALLGHRPAGTATISLGGGRAPAAARRAGPDYPARATGARGAPQPRVGLAGPAFGQ